MPSHKLIEFGPAIWRCEVCGQVWKKTPRSSCVGVPIYSWQSAPKNLLTKKQMSAAGFQTGKNLPAPAGAIRGKDLYLLYDRAQGVPKRPATAAQLAALERARYQSEIIDLTCSECGRWIAEGTRKRIDLRQQSGEVCFICAARDEASLWADERIKRGDFVILDTETTALDGEIIEIAIIGPDGATLLDTLIKPDHPERMLERDDRGVCASDIHGIQPADVESAPRWAEVWPDVKRLITDRPVLVYNAAFDYMGVLLANEAAGIPDDVPSDWQCIMIEYAAYVGEWSEKYHDFRYQKLNGGHRAAGDCRAALAVLREMAGNNEGEK